MSKTPREHSWQPLTMLRQTVEVCNVCWVIRRRDGANRLCKGPAKMRPLEKWPNPL